MSHRHEHRVPARVPSWVGPPAGHTDRTAVRPISMASVRAKRLTVNSMVVPAGIREDAEGAPSRGLAFQKHCYGWARFALSLARHGSMSPSAISKPEYAVDGRG